MRRALLTATTILLGSTALAAPEALTRDEARHLLQRTGFGSAPAEIETLIGVPAEVAVRRILAGIAPVPSRPMPDWTTGWIYPFDPIWTLSQTEQELFYANRYLEIEELAAWWLAEMVATPSPLTERLTLFWHDHFATSFDSEENSQWMARQNALFRAHAAGNFAALARGILRDPAMLTYLSNTENFAEAPNENLGREFLELFTLGEGNGYTETDVKEAARALTGHSVGDDGAYALFREDHDPGQKTILGQTGPMGADELAEVVLEDPSFGPYIVEKLWRAFISPEPEPAEVTRLTDVWKAADLELKPLLEALFLSDAFWAQDARGALVKSPVELLVGTLRSTGRAGLPMTEAVWITEELGQQLFFPPNVGGWQDGAAWINTSTALLRAQFLTDFAEGAIAGDGTAPMPVATEALPPPALAEGDLRVGRVFGRWAEHLDGGGMAIMTTLFDVGFGEETWRALTLYIEAVPGEGAAIYIPVIDCGPVCTDATVAYADETDGWFGVYLYDDTHEFGAPVSSAAGSVLGAVLSYLPELFDQTATSTAWMDYGGEDHDPPSFAAMADTVANLSERARRTLRPTEGALVMGFSRPGSDGLLGGVPGSASMMTTGMLDAYLTEAADARQHHAAPRYVYEDADAWLASFASSEAAMQSLLPVTIPVPDASAEEQLRALLLHPAYQLK
ncbi:MAG: DUF1800 domain-containing protein [Pseudomonadota bacterium]